ncbi:ras-related protein Rab-38-like [Actinia tenebrosa]|uniref:Ras-related protein Rab n=1 Tax=Actinia tenebrosa TaxID=6105 RepID=A0A6P8IXP8_ACTTE|nr:ras-related protein Rab-38-like [Actinia tenebrosa]
MEEEDDMDNVKEHLYKVLVIGEYGVGKTSIIRRYTEGYFSPNYKLTIGVDFALKVIHWDPKTKINLQLWDVAGHERFGHMTRVYYKYAIAAVIVFDVSRPATFEAVFKWYKDISEKVMLTNESPIPIILLANKCDLEEFPVDHEKLNLFCQENRFAGWFPTSAKEDKNIDEAMRFLVQSILSLSGKIPRPLMTRDCISLSSSRSGTPASEIGGYMVDYSYAYPTDESYNQEYIPQKKKSCC